MHQSVSDEHASLSQWGFKQARPAQQPSLPPLINARSETVLQLPTFRRLLFHRLGSRRCAVPITGFFEWHRSAPPGKPILTPYLVTRTSVSPAVAYLAGLYDDAAPPSTVQGQEGGDVTPRAYDAFVILTIAAVPEMRWLHARQPIFLHTERDLASWLHHGVTPCDAVAALAPETGLVSTRMLKDLSAPAPKRKEGRQRGIDSFFNANTKVSPSKHNSKLASTLVQLVGDNSVDGPREGDAGHKLGSSSDVSSPMTKTTNASLKARPTIQKSKTAATTPPRGKKGGQQSIRSFFTPTKKDK